MTSPLLDAHEAAGASVVEVGPDRFVASYRDLADELADARGDGARFDRSFRPRLRVSGDDHRDFLHRMSTAAITSLSAGSGTPTLFLERTGRLVDRLAALSFEDGMLLVGNQGRGAFARDWIERYVITELVDVLDVTAETFLITVLGTRAPEVLRTAFDVDVTDWVPWTHAPVELHDGQIVVARAEDVGGRSFWIIGPSSLAVAAWEALDALPAAGEETFRALRIDAGIPAFGEEYTDRSIPLETRMHDAISFTKGCYLGQEVIARLHNYKRVKRWLVRLSISGTDLPGDDAVIQDGADDIGTITSAVATPDGIVALGFVEHDRANVEAVVVRDGAVSRDARILPLNPNGDPA